MMDIAKLAALLQSIVCVTILMPLLLKLWAGARLDSFRQEMFIIRDELFDYAASGGISFNDPAYRLLRQLMNGFIRYGHQLTFFRLCMGVAQTKTMGQKPNLNWTTKWERALASIKDEEVKKSLEGFHSRAFLCAGKRLVLGSPVLLVISIFGALAIIIHTGVGHVVQVSSEATMGAMARVLRYLSSKANVGTIARVLGQISSEATIATVARVIDPRLLENEAAATAVA
jgi:hypothetical protein